MVVVGVLAILVSALRPSYRQFTCRAREAVAKSCAKTVRDDYVGNADYLAGGLAKAGGSKACKEALKNRCTVDVNGDGRFDWDDLDAWNNIGGWMNLPTDPNLVLYSPWNPETQKLSWADQLKPGYFYDLDGDGAITAWDQVEIYKCLFGPPFGYDGDEWAKYCTCWTYPDC